MSTILQSVKKKIYAACPEKMELGFGCEVVNLVNDDGQEIINPLKTRLIKNSVYTTWADDTGRQFEPIEPFCKILGHPLGLPEVLRAMKSELQFHHEPTQLWFRTKRPDYVLPPDKWIVWNLLVNLDGQSEEVWKFLDEIL